MTQTLPVWRPFERTDKELVFACLQDSYRPTVLALIRDTRGRLLLVQSARTGEWGFVQGGVEDGESPLHALKREVLEELGADSATCVPERYLGCADIDVDPGTGYHRRFRKGVRYFLFELTYFGPEMPPLQASELSGYEWIAGGLADPRFRDLLKGGRPAKNRLYVDALLRAS